MFEVSESSQMGVRNQASVKSEAILLFPIPPHFTVTQIDYTWPERFRSVSLA